MRRIAFSILTFTSALLIAGCGGEPDEADGVVCHGSVEGYSLCTIDFPDGQRCYRAGVALSCPDSAHRNGEAR